MKSFMDENFLLSNETAKELYHSHGAKVPVIDYHCHVSPKEIAEDMVFETITEAWLGGDHYKWRLLRANGIEEKFITGKDSSPYEKFQCYAEVLPKAIGNPLYHWTHLELKRYFDCDIPLSPSTCKEIWELCNKKLLGGNMSVRKIIEKSNVTAICTTDDPIDSLEWHKAMRDERNWNIKVIPAFRPDKAINIEKPGFADYLHKLSEAAGMPIKSLDDLKSALSTRIDFFASMGCIASDHGLDYVTWDADCEKNADTVLKKALAGQSVSEGEAETYKAALMLFLGREYAARGWVMQIHYGTYRCVNTRMTRLLGPDTGFDCISRRDCGKAIICLLDALDVDGRLPKTILYSLNPNDDPLLTGIIGCFQGVGIHGKIQHGSAWWFNDTRTGMEAQLTNLANMGILGNFVGMLTDSRSFLSYTRHEYFRRILCNLIGTWVENGEYPFDSEFLGNMVRDISYNNAVAYFGFNE